MPTPERPCPHFTPTDPPRSCATCAEWEKRTGYAGICRAADSVSYSSDVCEAWVPLTSPQEPKP